MAFVAGSTGLPGGPPLHQEPVAEAVQALAAPASVLEEGGAINTLNRLSADGDFELLVEATPGLLDALADALDRHNSPFLGLLHRRLARLQHHGGPAGAAAEALAFYPAALPPPWLDPAERALVGLDPGPVVLGLLSLLRNLAYIVANDEPIAFHPRLLAHLVSLLPCSGTPAPRGGGGMGQPMGSSAGAAAAGTRAGGSQPSRKGTLTGAALTGSNADSREAGAYAAETLGALGRALDVWGAPVLEEELLLAGAAAGDVPEDSLMALAPPSVRARCALRAPQAPQDPRQRQQQQAPHAEHGALVGLALSTLVGLVAEEDRPCVLRALECLARLLARENNACLVARHAPPSFLLRLHELLYVPAEGPDAMPMHPQQAAAVASSSTREEENGEGGREDGEGPTAAAAPRYAVDPKTLLAAGLDTELRDASLEVLSLLCAVPEAPARLLEHAPGLLRSLVFLLRAPRTGSGHATGRPEAAHMAARMVVPLAREGRDEGGTGALEGLRQVLTHYALRPGGEVAAEVLWAVFLLPGGGADPGKEDDEATDGGDEE